MPLIKSSSDAAFKTNVSEMVKAGHPQNQALAAAYRIKRQKRARGGMASGGDPGESYDPTDPTNDFDRAPLKQWPVAAVTPEQVHAVGKLNAVDEDPRFSAARAILHDRPASEYPMLHKAVHGLFGDAGGLSPYDLSVVGPGVEAKKAYDTGDYNRMIGPVAGLAAGVAGGQLMGKAMSAAPRLTGAGLGVGSGLLASSEVSSGDANTPTPADPLAVEQDNRIKALHDAVGFEPVKPPPLDLSRAPLVRHASAKEQYDKEIADWKTAHDKWKTASAALPGQVDAINSDIQKRRDDNTWGAWWDRMYNTPAAKIFPPLSPIALLAGAGYAGKKSAEIQGNLTNTYNTEVGGIKNALATAAEKTGATQFVPSKNTAAARASAQAKNAGQQNAAFTSINEAKGALAGLPPRNDAVGLAGIPTSALKGALISYAPQEADLSRLGSKPSEEAFKQLLSEEGAARLALPLAGNLASAGLGYMVPRSKMMAAPTQQVSDALGAYYNKWPIGKSAAKQGRGQQKGTPARQAKQSTEATLPAALAASPTADLPWKLPGWSETEGRARGGALSNLPDMHDGTTAHLQHMQDINMSHPQHYASGGISEPQMPWYAKNEARNMSHSGPIIGTGPGRTDHRNMSVGAGSYVLPAETVSHLGQSNSQAGLHVASAMFGHSGPYGAGAMAMRHASGLPRPPTAPKVTFSEGGGRGDEQNHKPVDIVAADGEFVVEPEVVRNIGNGDINHGHKILDRWVMEMRKKHIKTLERLDPPAKS